jgi:hypothetical protein
VCDLTDEEVMLFIQKMKRLEVCGKDGWFHLGAITIIRDKFREFVLKRIDEFLSKPRLCNTVSTDSTGRSCGNVDVPANIDSSDQDDIHARNSIILGERMKYWQDRYLALPDSGVATEADLAVYQNYAELHRKKSGMKSHRLQRIFRMVGKSLSVPKDGKPKLEGSKRDRKRKFSTGVGGGKSRKRKKAEASADSESDSEDEEEEEGEGEGEESKSKRVSFATGKGSKRSEASRRPSNAPTGDLNQDRDHYIRSSPYRQRDASVGMDQEELRRDTGLGYGSSSRGDASGSSSLGLDAVEAFSFFDNEDEDEDEDDDSGSDSCSDDEDNDAEGVLDPFGTHERNNFHNHDPDDDDIDEEEGEDADGSALSQRHSVDSAWL